MAKITNALFTSFKELNEYKKTFDNLNKLMSLGYTVKYIWERDWKNYKAGIDKTPNIITHIQSDLLTG